jgi:hypothetical protein
MNRSLLIILALTTSLLHAEDILRFTNGDQLHGTYKGIGDDRQILWERKDFAAQLSLKQENVRHIILGDAKPQKDPTLFAYVTLTNGDHIPGRVISLTDKTVEIESHALGKVSLSRSTVSGISPNPFGGKLSYVGPFSADGWEILTPPAKENTEGEENDHQEDGISVPAGIKEKPEEENKPDTSWKHAGSAWYHVNGVLPLIRKNCLSDSTRLRFRIAWRNRLNVNIALHADFATPPEPKKEEKEANHGKAIIRPNVNFGGFMGGTYSSTHFGNALVLNIYQTYFSLNRVGFDADGKPFSQRLVHTQSGVQLPNSGDALIEVRSDRNKGLLMIFINGQYAAQWEDLPRVEAKPKDAENEAAADMPLGNGFAIHCTGNTDPLRLSDFVISDWNGMKDSAYSMSHEKRDIILLANGTDRYSGEVTEINDKVVYFKNSFSELEIPLSDVSEINFAKLEKSEAKEAVEGTVTTRFYPTGVITGTPLLSDRNKLRINHPSASELNIDLSTVITMEFNDDNAFLESLDEEADPTLKPTE